MSILAFGDCLHNHREPREYSQVAFVAGKRGLIDHDNAQVARSERGGVDFPETCE